MSSVRSVQTFETKKTPAVASTLELRSTVMRATSQYCTHDRRARDAEGGVMISVGNRRRFLTFKTTCRIDRSRNGTSTAGLQLTEFDEQVFGLGDDTVEIVFGQHQNALVRLDRHLFLALVGERRVRQEERREHCVEDHDAGGLNLRARPERNKTKRQTVRACYK